MKDRKDWMRVLFVAVLLLGLAAPAVAQPELNDSEQPGSVLVFHKFIRNTVDFDINGNLVLPRTEIEISVTCPKGENCVTVGNFDGRPKVYLMAHWVCPGSVSNIEDTSRCNEVDFILETTVNGTIYFHPNGGTAPQTGLTGTQFEAVPRAPCSRGYLIVWVVDQFGRAIKFDGLIGDAIIRHGNTGDAGGAYDAVPIQAVSSLSTNDFTDVDTPDGDLDFDGLTEYKAVTGKIFGTVRYEQQIKGANFIKTDLTLLTLDVRSNRPNNPTFVDLNFYNEKEQVISVPAFDFVCWAEERLTDLNSNLNTNFGGMGPARKGLVESTNAEKIDFGIGDPQVGPVTLLGIISTREFEVEESEVENEYSYSLFNDGEPVCTTFVPHGATYSNCTTATTTPPPPPPGAWSTITFDDYYGNQGLNGEYPAGVADWGSGAWYLSGPWGAFTTNSISFSGSGVTSASFSFVSPRILVSLDAYNGGDSASTISISCAGNPTQTVTVNAGQLATITTGWSNACSGVTIGSSNGWATNFDNLKYQ